MAEDGGSGLTGDWLGIPIWGWLAVGAVGLYLAYRWYQGRQASSTSSQTPSTMTVQTQPPASVESQKATLDLPGGVSYAGPPWGLQPLLASAPMSVTTSGGAQYEGPAEYVMEALGSRAPSSATGSPGTTPTSTPAPVTTGTSSGTSAPPTTTTSQPPVYSAGNPQQYIPYGSSGGATTTQAEGGYPVEGTATSVEGNVGQDPGTPITGTATYKGGGKYNYGTGTYTNPSGVSLPMY